MSIAHLRFMKLANFLQAIARKCRRNTAPKRDFSEADHRLRFTLLALSRCLESERSIPSVSRKPQPETAEHDWRDLAKTFI